MLKGVSLSFNAIVIILLAVLVLALISSFFISSSGKSQTSLNNAAEFSKVCIKIKAGNYCDTTDIDNEELNEACKNFLKIDNPQQCNERCCGREKSCIGLEMSECNLRSDDCRWIHGLLGDPGYCAKNQ